MVDDIHAERSRKTAQDTVIAGERRASETFEAGGVSEL
jgi:hypothetical protein